jgi:hypothetical protein
MVYSRYNDLQRSLYYPHAGVLPIISLKTMANH